MSGLSSPELAGKPKLFFIQACQGPIAQRGCPVQADATPDDHVFIPEHTDFLIAHSTLPGFASFRSPQNGSFFVDKLTEDIVKMLTMVNDKIASVDLFHAHEAGISKQASVFSSSLRKDLYFNIGSSSGAADDNFTSSGLAQRALLDRLVSFHEYEEPIAATRTTPLPLSAKAQAALSRTFRQLSTSSDPPSSPIGGQHPPEAAPSGSPDADTSAILGRIMQIIASNQQPSTASGADHDDPSAHDDASEDHVYMGADLTPLGPARQTGDKYMCLATIPKTGKGVYILSSWWLDVDAKNARKESEAALMSLGNCPGTFLFRRCTDDAVPAVLSVLYVKPETDLRAVGHYKLNVDDGGVYLTGLTKFHTIFDLIEHYLQIIKAIKSLKSGKAAGPDGIPPEALKADIQTSTDMLHPLLRKIWESESVPQDWKKGHLVKLPKKGDLSSCSNWRGIMLLSIPGKVLTRIILERLKTALDKTLREEQAGFRNDRSCTDNIATMRIIIEQSLEWQTPLYSTFADFQKAFDSVDREVIWKLMSHYGFPPKFVNIIRQLYEDATCQVIHDGKLTEPFTVRTGVRQGCILSPTIFLMVVDWVMRQATDSKRTGIQWTFSKQLEDLDFADDIALLSHKQQDAQEKLNRVAEEAEKTGLKINISKTEVMRVNHKQHDPIQLHQEDIKEVDKFIYLGSVVSKDGGTDEDIKSRTNKARHAFRTLRPIWRSTALSLRNKIRIFNSNVKSVLLYGSETWRTTKTSSHKLQTFINRCLRNILNIRYPLVITNQDLWEGTRQVPIEQEIKKRKWGWIGHTLRKSTSNVTRQSLDWNPQGKRKVGRPKQTWRRSTDAEAKAAGTTWAELKRASQNRVRWRSVVAALCSPGNKED
nr:hypothetical protein BaRGS_006375 [Batillaria attramentaria]